MHPCFPYSGLRVTAQSSIFMTCKCQPWPCMYRGERILKTITNTQYVWVVCGKQRSLAVGLLTLASCSRLVAEIIMHHSYSIVTRRKSLPSSQYLVVVTKGLSINDIFSCEMNGAFLNVVPLNLYFDRTPFTCQLR